MARLRPSNVDPAEGALEELQRIIGLIREKWHNTHIIVRGDSAYAREDLEEVRKLVPQTTWFRSIYYQTERSWSRQRRVVTKVGYGSEGLELRHVVTSLPTSQITPSQLYTQKYCPRMV